MYKYSSRIPWPGNIKMNSISPSATYGHWSLDDNDDDEEVFLGTLNMTRIGHLGLRSLLNKNF